MKKYLNKGPWKLSSLKVKPGSPTVFSCFCCGGGSSMGYKLAGFNVLGGVEIDEDMAKLYRKNLNPKYLFKMPVQDFLKEKKVPKELFNLDILDGSPPCSSFSMAGNREKDWGKSKKFREGQQDQVLDDLFFQFIAIARQLQPKVVVSENVKGLIAGNARGYVKDIFNQFEDAGYETQLFLFNSSKMGVPQYRQRVFFISRRADLKLKKIVLDFNEEEIPVKEAIKGIGGKRKPLSDAYKKWWVKTPPGKPLSINHPKGSFFNSFKLHPDYPSFTVTATGGAVISHWEKPEMLSGKEISRLQAFPDDYDFLDQDPKYVCGMSVPPNMTQRIALEIKRQLLSPPSNK